MRSLPLAGGSPRVLIPLAPYMVTRDTVQLRIIALDGSPAFACASTELREKAAS